LGKDGSTIDRKGVSWCIGPAAAKSACEGSVEVWEITLTWLNPRITEHKPTRSESPYQLNV